MVYGERFMWLFCVCGFALFCTILGIYAWRRKEPMWFWAGSTVRKEQIKDVKAYNRANGILWMAFSIIQWAAGLLGIWNMEAAEKILMYGDTVGLACVFIGYLLIWRKYRKTDKRG